MSKSRLFYIDNLRIFLISLVVLHHFAITYGAPGDWYYNESQAGFPAIIPLAMFVASNQAFFMGMFFFVSAFFIVPSLVRKGIKRFVFDRLIRLGIPTAVFYFLLSPLTVFIRIKCIENSDTSFLQVLQNGLGMSFGPMWFVEALLMFSVIYLILHQLKWKVILKFPSTLKILMIVFLIGILQFLIRIDMPIGTGHEFTNFQFPFFVQYIFLFGLGIIAYQNKWMDAINSKMGWRWFIVANILILIVFPVLFAVGGATAKGIEIFMGGYTWQSLAYCVWEQLVGFSLIIGLFGIFKKRFNRQGVFTKRMSDSAYGVYVFHSPVLVGISAIFLSWSIPQFLKFIVLAPVALGLTFLIAWLAKQIPGVKNVL